MISTIRRMWRVAPWATALMGLALLVALFFAVRLTAFWIYWADPDHHNQAIAGWMTPRYVANSWHVPPEVVGNALGLNVEKPHRITLDQLARERGVPLSDLVDKLQAAIAAQHKPEP